MNNLQARNEIIINAPVSAIWAIITDINMLTRVNPGVVNVSGAMDRQGATRVCQIDNKGRKGTMTEKLLELVPEKKTVWTIESDTMGMSKMLIDTRFVFHLEKQSDHKTKVISETHYRPANLLVKIMNRFMMKKMISKAQGEILSNIKSLTEK